MAHANYLTYEEYKELGGALAQTDFFRLEFSARKRIDYLTNSTGENELSCCCRRSAESRIRLKSICLSGKKNIRLHKWIGKAAYELKDNAHK